MASRPVVLLLSYHRYLLVLALLFAIEWIWLSVAPWDRAAWAMENALVLFLAIVLWITHWAFPFSRVSYTCIFLFLCLHEIGAHFTYADVPYDAWFQRNLGFSLNQALGMERNQFDRLVHFCYGLLFAYPIREVFIRIAAVRGFWAYFLPLDLTMSSSALFELFEWAVAVIFGGELGMDYLGTQGDVWDAHKDMALASLGALIAMSVTAGINIYSQRDFADEWGQSLRVKRRRPLGENAWRWLRELRQRRR